MLEMNGKKFEFDLFEFETAEKYEKAFVDINEEIVKAQEIEVLSQSIVMQCDAIRKVLDRIFGDGTGANVCGEKYNLNNHLSAFEALVDEATRQRREFDNRGKRYAPNRTKRKGNKYNKVKQFKQD